MHRRAALLRAQLAVALLAALVQPRAAANVFGNWFQRGRQLDPAREMIQQYDLLNSELVREVESGLAIDNIMEALEWLKMASGEQPKRPNLELPSKEALVRFTSLVNLMDPEEPNCDLSSYNILYDNELATGTDISVTPEELTAQRRVEAVIYEVAYQHANQCRYVYPHLFKLQRASQPPRLMRDIKSMMNAMIETSKRLVFTPKNRALDPRHVLARKSKGISVTGYAEAVALLMNVRQRARDNPDSRYLKILPDPKKRNHWIVNEAKVAQLMQGFVYSRCEFMATAFEHIFKPADFDQQLFSNDRKYRAINDETAELLLWLEYYRLCQSMLANKSKLDDNIIKAIWSELKA